MASIAAMAGRVPTIWHALGHDRDAPDFATAKGRSDPPLLAPRIVGVTFEKFLALVIV
jgi:hypothetical protein